jgi:hypothetical protein
MPMPWNRPNPSINDDTQPPTQADGDSWLIALSVLALELPVTAAELGERLASDVVTDGIGRRCVDKALAATVIREHREAEAQRLARQAEQDAQWLARMAEQLAVPAARTRAIAERQERLRAAGELSDDASAWDALGYSAEAAERAEAEADRHADMARGVSTGGTFRVEHCRD